MRPTPLEVRDTKHGRAGLYRVTEIARVPRGSQREQPDAAWFCWNNHPHFIKSRNLRDDTFAVALEADVDAAFASNEPQPVTFASADAGVSFNWNCAPADLILGNRMPPPIPREPKNAKSTKELERLARGENPRDRVPVPTIGHRCPRCHRVVDASRSMPCQLCSPEKAHILMGRSAVASVPAFTPNKFPGFGWDPEGNG